jgi:hypothetical protein
VDGAGTLQGRWSLASGRVAGTGCAICRKPVLPGVKLCGACRAALKRARQVTVSEELSSARPRAQVRRVQARKVPATQSPAPADRRGASKRLAAGAGIALAMAIGGLLAFHVLRSPGPAPAVPAPVAPVPATLETGTAPDLAAVRAEPKASPSAVAVPRAVPAPPRAAAAKRAPEPAAPPTDAVPERAQVIEPPAPEPKPIPVAAPPRPAPAPDRWQLLASATAACASESLFARVVCEERARLQYCEGYWGLVAQCPRGAFADHGR